MKKNNLHPQTAKAGIILTSFGIIVGIIRWSVLGRLVDLYQNFEVPLPMTTQVYIDYGYLIAASTVVIGVMLVARSKQSITTLKASSTEPVPSKSYPSIFLIIIVLLAISALISFLFSATIYPIYNLTGNL